MECLGQLKDKQNSLSVEDMFQIYLEVRSDIVYATKHFGSFWRKFRSDEAIDVVRLETSFYTVLYARIGLPMGIAVSKETADRASRLLSMDGHESVAQATNAFINAMIRELKQPDLALAHTSF